uniref:Ig-like domain-containing protein n=1 Tax=Chelonoidis abingdonii TaxID=106734 RepID=A0A8C0IPN1_CHEAB
MNPDVQAKLDSTKIQVLLPSTEQDGKVSYMCLIQDFYPNVIKVTWEDDEKNTEKNASYSLSSWLTVDKNSNKNYRCKYQHESKGDYVPMESPGIYYIIKTNIMDSFIHRTAYLIYIVLLLKSTMYYVIVLFFIYRMQSPIKRHGRKP